MHTAFKVLGLLLVLLAVADISIIIYAVIKDKNFLRKQNHIKNYGSKF